MSSFGSCGSIGRAGDGAPRGVENPETGIGIPSRIADVAGAQPHHVEELRLLERRPASPHGGSGSGHERGREARSAQGEVACRHQRERRSDGDLQPGRGQVELRRRAREDGHLVVLVGRADREHVREVGRVLERAQDLAVVARRRDDQRPAGEGRRIACCSEAKYVAPPKLMFTTPRPRAVTAASAASSSPIVGIPRGLMSQLRRRARG